MELLFEDHEIGTTVLGHDIVGAVLDGFEISLGEHFDLFGGNSEGDEVLAGGGGAAVAETQVILGGSAPVAAALDEEAMLGVGVEVGLGGVKFGAFGSGDGGLVEGEIDRLEQAADGHAVVDDAVAVSERAAGLKDAVTKAGAEVARSAGGERALLADYGAGGIGANRFVAATAREEGGGSHDYEEEFAGDRVHEMGGYLTLSRSGLPSTSTLCSDSGLFGVNAPMSNEPAIFLFDNGSFRAEATLSLRRLAVRLGARLGRPVEAVSLLHSTRVSPAELGGLPARLLEPALDAWWSGHPEGRAILLPLFFGPSGALVDYVPERLVSLRAKHPNGRAVLADALVVAEEEPVELVAALADQVRATIAERGWHKPKVALCDHGTPLRTVTAVRNRLAAGLAEALTHEAEGVAACSMERREGDEYAFNEPLLEHLLAKSPFDVGEVVVALQFLSPGRHAGPAGDVAEICGRAEQAAKEGGRSLRTAMTGTLADDARVAVVLARRAEAAREKLLHGN